MHDTRQPPFLKHAENNGLVKFTGEGKTERIHYIAANHSERWSDKEEKVRAEFWAELIYKYEYRPERIRFEVKVPRRTPSDLADLVIYGDKDEQLKAPYFVFECKSADVSDAEFTQAIEQACGNRANLAASFCGVIAGIRDQIKTPGQNYLSLAHVQSNTGELTTSNEEAAGACSEYQTGDVLFARLRPYPVSYTHLTLPTKRIV